MVVVMFVLFLVLLILGVPIAFSLGASSLFYLFMNNIPLAVITQKFFAGMDSFTLLCIPGFMLAGSLMNGGGITKRILDFCNAFLGHFTGSLALVNVVASMVFAGISGTAIADVCSLGGMLIPAMVEDGYDDDFSVAVTAASSVVGPIIPPSVPMVIAGSCVSISVGKMFQAGIIPGIMLGLALCIPTYIISVRRHYPKHAKVGWKQRLKTTRNAIWAIIMPLILLGGILSGIFTPTEASVVTCVYALVVGIFIYKEIKFQDVPRILWENLRSCASIIILIGFANVFGYILTAERIPQMVANGILSITSSRIAVILLINIVLLFVGMFMESLAAILITFPVLLPVATAVGMDPVHFALMAILNLMIGLTTPPVGMCICTGAQIGRVSTYKAFKANTPFLLTSLTVLALVSFVPQITLWIPGLLAS
ncbi:MAG: TRAP transporter large permease [Ruminococcaceae bacterium]|nr:TRAP transporter large permease [Oscillospiraceae bacterium]